MKHFGLFVMLGLLASCAVQTQPAVELPGEDPAKTIQPQRGTSSAVLGLLEQAREATQAGDYQRAEVLLERTVRIEPRNATLWHYLAKLRLHQGRYQEAIGLASKSNNLGKDDKQLLADNWRIVAHSKYQLGDRSGAEQAQARANRLLNER